MVCSGWLWRGVYSIAINYPKELGQQSRLIGFEDAMSPMSRALESVPRVGGKGAKETSSKALLDVGFDDPTNK
jgi:hypothetical protein